MALRKTNTQDRHQKFVEEYLKTLNATQAAINAGYSKTNARNQGWTLLHDPELSKQIQEGLARRSEQCGVDTQWVIEQAKALVLDPKTPPKDKAKALDLLGRYTGAWNRDTAQQTQQTVIEVKLSD